MKQKFEKYPHWSRFSARKWQPPSTKNFL